MNILKTLGLVLLLSNCGKKSDGAATPSPSLTKPKTFSLIDANNAFDSFNTAFYDTNRKLYYSKSDRKDIAEGWTQAVFWDSAMAAYKRSKSEAHLKLVNEIYQGGALAYSNFDWKKVKEINGFIYDDMMWWIISLSRAYELTNDQKYLDVATAGFKYVWDNSYDPIDGGMRWSWKVDGKNACINYPTVIAAMTLYNITKKQDYMDKAKNIYTWSRTNLFQTSTGRVADHKVGNNPPGFEDYTYNQGTFIGAAVMLFKATNDQDFLTDAKLAADYTKNKMSDGKGVLPAEGEWNEQGVLKAVFAQYMQMLIVDAGQSQYSEWMHYNINLAWVNRDQKRTLMFRDYKVACPTGVIQSFEASSGVAFMQLFDPIAN
ncbi:Glycosyl hydrolase family 76 [Pedobacter steynii]|uniref:Glycosyl hydrolase family 76 n=1 Tax=Pedobacter steynii TaxID=430522 RepID=A0A1G9KA22_9SPHI|nr:glycoside hydrolase family 76 protein [Pedobacter steynii]NQX38490.1 alpha-1,6-mannanase [Pedobacter steynii]SDL46416.1 Glycosyl hydrolase family 76 [Pedobacter steynii]